MKGNRKILVYNEPHPTGGNCRVSLTEKQAIDSTRKILLKLHPDKAPFSDKDCLDDFIVIHWASYEEDSS